MGLNLAVQYNLFKVPIPPRCVDHVPRVIDPLLMEPEHGLEEFGLEPAVRVESREERLVVSQVGVVAIPVGFPGVAAVVGALRIGVDEPEHIQQADYVLGLFTPEQQDQVEPALEGAVNAAIMWIASGVDEAMNNCNESGKSESRN